MTSFYTVIPTHVSINREMLSKETRQKEQILNGSPVTGNWSAVSGVSGWRGRRWGERMGEQQGGLIKGHKETSGGNGYVRYLDFSDGFTGIYTSNFIQLHSLNMCSSLLLVNYTSLVHWFIIRGCFSIINQWTTKSPPQFNLKLFSITSLYLSCRLELIFLIPTNKKCLYLKVYSFPTNSLFLTPLTTFS